MLNKHSLPGTRTLGRAAASFSRGTQAEGDSAGSGRGFWDLSSTPTPSPGSLALAAFQSLARGHDSYSLGGSPRTRLNSWPKGGTQLTWRKGNYINRKKKKKKKIENSAEPQWRLSQKYYFFYCYFIRFLYFFSPLTI